MSPRVYREPDRVAALEARVASLELLVRSLLLFGGRAPETHDRRCGPGLEAALASYRRSFERDRENMQRTAP